MNIVKHLCNKKFRLLGALILVSNLTACIPVALQECGDSNADSLTASRFCTG